MSLATPSKLDTNLNGQSQDPADDWTNSSTDATSIATAQAGRLSTRFFSLRRKLVGLGNSLADNRFYLPAAAAVFRERKSGRLVWAGAILLFCVIALAVLFYRASATASSPEEKVVAQWLNAQLAGATGAEFYEVRPGHSLVYYEGLRSWRIASHPAKDEFVVTLNAEDADGNLASGNCRVRVVGNRSVPQSRKVVVLELLPVSPAEK